MKAVIVLPYLKSMGGASRYGWELSEFMASKGDDITIASITSTRNNFKSDQSISIIDLADESYLPQTIKYWLNFTKIRKNLKSLISKIICCSIFSSKTSWSNKSIFT